MTKAARCTEYVTPALLSQQWHGRLDDRKSAENVRFIQCSHIVRASFLNRTDKCIAGIIDNNVEPSEVSMSFLHSLLHLIGLGYVQLQRQNVSAVLFFEIGNADDLMALIFGLFARPAFMKLLDAGQEWSIKREEFKSALQQRVAKTLMIHSPNLSKKAAADIALVVLLNVKAVATHQAFSVPTSSVPEEFRDMTRLYLQSRLRSGKRSIPPGKLCASE